MWVGRTTRHEIFESLVETVQVASGPFQSRADGTVHEYCPPEHTASEMERLIAMHRGHGRDGAIPAPVEAAWLRHRFVQIHPFEDGNGRTARLLMSYVFARRAEPTPVITAMEKPRYFDALQEADRGALRTSVQMLETKAVEGIRYATRSIENMLDGRAQLLPHERRPEHQEPGERMDASSRDERTRERDRRRRGGHGRGAAGGRTRRRRR